MRMQLEWECVGGSTFVAVSSSVGICKEIYLITVGLTEANVATVLAGWLSK